MMWGLAYAALCVALVVRMRPAGLPPPERSGFTRPSLQPME